MFVLLFGKNEIVKLAFFSLHLKKRIYVGDKNL